MQTFCGQTVTVIDTDALQCGHVSDVGVLALGRGCGQLRGVDFYGCDQVTDAGVSDATWVLWGGGGKPPFVLQ